MRNRARAVLFTTAALLSAMLAWAWQNRPPAAESVQTAAATVQDIYNSVTFSGTVEAADATALCPQTNAVVAAVHTAVGETVEQGEVLCTLALVLLVAVIRLAPLFAEMVRYMFPAA